jgi:fibronectin-binding autotransporter adhesin
MSVIIDGTTYPSPYNLASGTYNDVEVESGAELIIDSGNEVTFTNQVDNFGTINNNGIINNQASSTIYTEGAINNNGTITNDGIIESDAMGYYYMSEIKNNTGGTIINNGTIDVDAIITNDGTIENNNDGEVYIEGSFCNNGTIENDGTITVNENGELQNKGTLNNNSEGTIINLGKIDTETNGKFNNEGKFYNLFTPNITHVLIEESGANYKIDFKSANQLMTTDKIAIVFPAGSTFASPMVTTSAGFESPTFGTPQIIGTTIIIQLTAGTAKPDSSLSLTLSGITLFNGDTVSVRTLQDNSEEIDGPGTSNFEVTAGSGSNVIVFLNGPDDTAPGKKTKYSFDLIVGEIHPSGSTIIFTFPLGSNIGKITTDSGTGSFSFNSSTTHVRTSFDPGSGIGKFEPKMANNGNIAEFVIDLGNPMFADSAARFTMEEVTNPLTNDEYSVVFNSKKPNNDPLGEYTVYYYIAPPATKNINGALTNNSTLCLSGVTNNYSNTIINNDTLILDGTLNNITDGTIINNGTIIINGTLNNDVTIINNGTIIINPPGILNNGAAGSIFNNANGVITNNGILNNIDGGTITNFGTINGKNPVNGPVNEKVPCFSYNTLQKIMSLYQNKMIITVKSTRKNKKMIRATHNKFGVMEFTNDHPFYYQNRFIPFEKLIELNPNFTNIYEMTKEECDMVYNIIGHPNPIHKDNMFILSDDLCMLGAKYEGKNPEYFLKKKKVLENLLNDSNSENVKYVKEKYGMNLK